MRKVLNFLKRKWWLIALLLVVGIGIFIWKPWKKPDVKTSTIQRGEVKEELVLSGNVTAEEYAKLNFATSGELKFVGVKEGDWVEKGQLLAYLDTSELRTRVIAAENTWLAADAAAKKAEDDVKDHDKDESFEQKNTRVSAQTARDTAYFNWQQAKRDLRDAYLYAPFAGVITQVTNPYPNINISSTQAQIEILNPQTIYFSVKADQTEIGDLKIGQEVKIVLDSFLDDEFVGKIKVVAYTPEADGGYEVKVAFDQIDENRFRVGMTGDASFIAKVAEDVLFVQRSFVNSDRDGKFLNVGSSKNKVRIELGLEGDNVVEVKGDLEEGQTIYD